MIQIGTIGRISPWKGQEIFLESAALVCKVFPRTHFHIVGAPLFGEEAFERQLHAMTSALQLESRVTFAGFRRDVPEYIRSLHIVGGPSEIIEDGVTGFLVTRKDPEALAAAILQLLRDPHAAGIVAQQGQQAALERFGSQETTRAVEAIYERLLSSDRMA